MPKDAQEGQEGAESEVKAIATALEATTLELRHLEARFEEMAETLELVLGIIGAEDA